MPHDSCLERDFLSNRLATATAALDKANAMCESATARQVENLEEFLNVLSEAQNVVLAAALAFDTHVQEHGCLVNPPPLPR